MQLFLPDKRAIHRRLLRIVFAVICVQNLTAQTWQTTPSPIDAQSVACLQDDRTFLANCGDGVDLFYKSTNAGENWTNLAYPVSGSVLTASDNGSKIAIPNGDSVLISTNGGVSFNQNYGAPSTVAAWSKDGSLLVVAAGRLSLSANDGLSWLAPSAMQTNDWAMMALSESGRVLIAAAQTLGGLRVSTNFGVNWNIVPVTNQDWMAVACTANGSNIIAAPGETPIRLLVSHDSGGTWAYEIPGGLSQPGFHSEFSSLTCSGDGGVLVATVTAGAPAAAYISRDFGRSWTFDNGPGKPHTLACSIDGTVLLGSFDDYVEVQYLPPPLALSIAGSQITLSWPAPSSQYALQQIGDLSGTNWAAVTNAVTVTNYRNTLTLPAPATGNTFYRLNGPN